MGPGMRLIAVFVLIVSSPSLAASAQFEALFTEWDSTHTPGCSAAIDRDGEPLFRKAFGMANLDHSVPADVQTRYHVASVSKQFTAAAVLILAREGKVALDAHPGTYLPAVSDLPGGISVRQLIHHTSGIRDQWDLLGLAGWRYSLDRITNKDVMTMLARQRDLNFPPNSEFLYSNSGYTLLAEIVEQVSGQSFRDFTRERIFEPVGMTRTFFRDDFGEVVPNHAAGYIKSRNGYTLSVTNFDTVGATSLMTTPADLVKWGNLFIEGDSLVAGMTRQGVLADGEEIPYAFGVDVSIETDRTIISHGGSDAGYRAFLLSVPEDRISVAVACNVPTDTGRLSKQLYAAAAGQVPPAAADKEHESLPYPDAFDGDFYSPETGLMWRFRNGVATFMAFQSELVATGKREIAMPARGITGLFNRDYSAVTITAPSGQAVYGRVAPREDDLDRFTGAYYSAELDAVYRLRRDGDSVILDYIKHPGIRLVQVDDNVFSGEVGTLTFSADDKGVPDGFILNTFRIRNLLFSRIDI